MDTIRGFSRESFVGVTTNIESQEARRMTGPYPENPRGGTTDPVENFFATVHRYLGTTFTLHDFKYGWQKITR